MDDTARVYEIVRDATVCNDFINMAESIAVLEVVKAELIARFLKTMGEFNE